MADIRKLIESIDSIESVNEDIAKTVANSEHFIEDIFRALGNISGSRGKTINITVTARGTNMLEYSISEVTPKVAPSEEEQLEKARMNRGYF